MDWLRPGEDVRSHHLRSHPQAHRARAHVSMGLQGARYALLVTGSCPSECPADCLSARRSSRRHEACERCVPRMGRRGSLYYIKLGGKPRDHGGLQGGRHPSICKSRCSGCSARTDTFSAFPFTGHPVGLLSAPATSRPCSHSTSPDCWRAKGRGG